MGDLALSAWDSGAAFFDWALIYIIIGGAIVVPVYVVRSLLKYLSKKPGTPTGQNGQTREE